MSTETVKLEDNITINQSTSNSKNKIEDNTQSSTPNNQSSLSSNSNKKSIGYATESYALESSGSVSNSSGGFGNSSGDSGYDIIKEYKMETSVISYGAFLIEEGGKKFLIPGGKNDIQSQVSGIKVLPNTNIQKCGFQDKEPILVGCVLSKALLDGYLNKYYPGDTNISGNIEKVIAAGLLHANIQIQTGKSTSANLDLVVTGIDSSCPNEFIGINGAAILSTKTNIKTVVMKGNTTIELPTNLFSWNNFKEGKIDGYNGTLLLEQISTEVGKSNEDIGSTIDNKIDTITYKSYGYISNINNSNLLARIKIYVSENENTANIFTSDNKEIFNSGVVSASWLSLGSTSAGAWTGEQGNLTDKEYFYATKEVRYTNAIYEGKIYTQDQIRTNKTEYGSPILGTTNHPNLVLVKAPPGCPMTIGAARPFYVHRLAVPRVQNIIKDIMNHYGSDLAEVAPALLTWNGCHRPHLSKNSKGTFVSIHNYGLAIDIDYAHNGLNSGGPWNKDNSRLCTNPVYLPLFKIMAHHGFYNLGTHMGKDFMHFQCCDWYGDNRKKGQWWGNYFKAPTSTKKYK